MAVASTVVTRPPNRAARGHGGGAVLVVESCARTGSAANAIAVSRTNESFVIDFIYFVEFVQFKFSGTAHVITNSPLCAKYFFQAAV
jgi:hypothetical protein